MVRVDGCFASSVELVVKPEVELDSTLVLELVLELLLELILAFELELDVLILLLELLNSTLEPETVLVVDSEFSAALFSFSLEALVAAKSGCTGAETEAKTPRTNNDLETFPKILSLTFSSFFYKPINPFYNFFLSIPLLAYYVYFTFILTYQCYLSAIQD